MSEKDLIITLPNKHLRRHSQKVGVITDEVRRVIKDMKAAAIDWEDSRPHEVGVALAAIQINRPLKIIVVRNDFDKKEDKTFSIFINPQIVKLEGKVEEDFEGCLSVSDIYGKVPRYTKIRMRALDENGESVRVRAEGFLARVLQHEVDHLNGTVFIDHIENQPEAFYKLSEQGKLEQLDYEQVRASGIFRD
ncbi:peptide deformylase [Candidatus Saccharibacteria bacterium RIFCSPHIGHO2_12_FULL_49_19]|nr:MAG: peptide deformylase [Candidatus Saccharibacteria bacterium RIFCSPHIGHO2_01_FULL_49_21]OGL36595.1 MAG: peptide deformylase [Candidatus Saccharibacteria bacterium RIFCSPHIGHO2_12_FULL_49_19]OGL37860.1 MAG: peptide deformylase [Candidatus Saccharibacteria bacterium RIFCSPLOWO2_01_FULL_49_22]